MDMKDKKINRRIINLLLVIALLLTIAQAQTLNSGSTIDDCPCNQVSGINEYQCCCDTDKGTITPTSCLDKNYGSLFQIPLYKDLQKKAMSIDDLYNPFRLIYQVIKTLGSVLNRNGVQRKIDFTIGSPSETKDFASILLAQQNQQTFNQLPTYLKPEQRVIQRAKLSSDTTRQQTLVTAANADYVNMYVKDQATGKCIPFTATKYETVPYQACRVKNSNLYTKITTTAPTGLCYNLNANYELFSTTAVACTNTPIGFVYTYTTTNNLIYITHPTPSNNIFLGAKIFFDYDLYNTATDSMTQKPKVGYQIGDPLIFYSSETGILQKGMTFNDIYDKFGACYSTTLTYNMLNPIDITFGKNITISCRGENWRVDTFLPNIAYVGIFPNANPKYSDWVEISGSKRIGTETTTVTTSNDYAFQIYYQKQGKKTNPTYRITQVKRVILTTKVINSNSDSLSNKRTASILFYEEPQTPNYYLSKPPEIKIKLPRDILYPFYTFNE